MDIHQLVAPGPIQCDPHEEQSLGMEWSPAEEKHSHNGHQHPYQRPLPVFKIPGVTMLIINNFGGEEELTHNFDFFPEL